MWSPTQTYYDANAERLAAQYRDADVSSLQALLRRWLPASGRVLEIGCGSGRDAVFMASLGLTVVATDASEPMIVQAKCGAGQQGIDFRHVAFPLPQGHELLNERFDAVVAVAVLMHISDQELFDFAFQVRTLLKTGGRFVCSFCSGREPSADDPRLYVNRESGEVRLLFERLGFQFFAKEVNRDGLGRGMVWTTLVFGYEHQAGARPVDQIESIINHDKKDATYKLALLRALCEIAQTSCHHVRWHADNTVSVPLGLVAEKWLYYYWLLIYTGGEPIKQRRGNQPIAFQSALIELAAHFGLGGGG